MILYDADIIKAAVVEDNLLFYFLNVSKHDIICCLSGFNYIVFYSFIDICFILDGTAPPRPPPPSGNYGSYIPPRPPPPPDTDDEADNMFEHAPTPSQGPIMVIHQWQIMAINN